MQTIDIYDSEGNEYGSQRAGPADQRIQDFFFAGLKLAVDITGEPEVVCFFRARESETGRSEQFYAVYQTGSERNLFSNFKKGLERTIDQYGLTLVTDTDDTQFYHELDREMGTPPGDEMQRTVIAEGSGRGQPMRVGVGTTRDAFSLVKSFLSDRDIRSVAIADKTTGSVFEDYTLSIETGQYRGIEPLGDTQSYLDDVRDSIEDQLVSDRINVIQEEVRTIRTETSVSSSELKNRLKRQLSVLDPPAVEKARDRSDNSRLPVTGHTAAIAVVLLIVLIAVGGVTWYLGIPPLGSGEAGDGGTDGNTAAIESVSISGEELPEDGVHSINLSTNETVNLAVSHSAESITASLNGNEINDTTDQSEFTAEIPAKEFTDGNNTLTIAAGETEREYTIIVTYTTGDSEIQDTEKEQPSLTVETPLNDTVVRNAIFNVSGSSNGDSITVEFRNNSTDKIVDNATQTATVGANDSFSVMYRVPETIPEGTYDIIINATQDGEYETTIMRNVTIANNTTNPEVGRWGHQTYPDRLHLRQPLQRINWIHKSTTTAY